LIRPGGESGYVEANGIRLHYLAYGQAGQPLVIVPGITSPAITWEFVAEMLAGDFRVITMDVRGRGLSEKPSSGYTLPDYAADAASFIEALELERPIVLGHSMGARIAAALGALHPEAPGPLIVVDPPLTGPGRRPYPFPLHVYVEALREAQAGATADDMRRYFPTWSDEQLQIRAEWLATCDERAVVETYENFAREDFFGYWRTLSAPLVFVYGEESPVVPPSGVEEVAAANPAAAIVGVPSAGHMIPWDNLPGFLTEVRRFADSLARV
jgi:N-formylmaleamate deformylase